MSFVHFEFLAFLDIRNDVALRADAFIVDNDRGESRLAQMKSTKIGIGLDGYKIV